MASSQPESPMTTHLPAYLATPRSVHLYHDHARILPLNMPALLTARACYGCWSLLRPPASGCINHGTSLNVLPFRPAVLGHLAKPCCILEAREGHVDDLLAKRIPKGSGNHGHRVAIELVAMPYHSMVEGTHNDEVCRSRAMSGTTPFFPYATASAVVRERGYSLARCRVRAKQTAEHVLCPRLACLGTLGSNVQRLLLDRGFYTVRGIQTLLTARVLSSCRQSNPVKGPPERGPQGHLCAGCRGASH